jgi:acyl-CoA synthetase (AMP-forming)/AMP-acid ligase II
MPVAFDNFGEMVPRELPGDLPWIIEVAPDGSHCTTRFAQMQAQADALARGLLRRGLPRGAGVGLLAGNSVRYLIAFLGIQRAGLVAVPINPRLPAAIVEHIHVDSGIRLTLADDMALPTLGKRPALCLDRDVDWNSLLDPGRFTSPAMRPEEVAVVLYTSGSTGRPKGVPLTHGGYTWAADFLVASGPPMAGKRVLVAAPLFHMNGLLMSLLTSRAGGTVVLLKRFSAAQYLQSAARWRCHVLTSVPTMLALAAREIALIETLDLGAVEIVVTGSAPATDSLYERIARVFPNARVMNSYGTTESSPVVFGPHPQGLPRPRLALGYPVPQAEWKLVDGPDENEGVLWLRSPAVMPGYLNLPDETARRMHDGWYDTGDVMRRDAEGFFYFVGRNDDMFVCGGENVFPGEVEKLLETHPAIAQAAVVPVPDEIKGQLPAAFVVTRPGARASAEEIRQYALENAPAYRHPRFVEFLDEMPLAGPNKIDRRQLVALAASRFRR